MNDPLNDCEALNGKEHVHEVDPTESEAEAEHESDEPDPEYFKYHERLRQWLNFREANVAFSDFVPGEMVFCVSETGRW